MVRIRVAGVLLFFNILKLKITNYPSYQANHPLLSS